MVSDVPRSTKYTFQDERHPYDVGHLGDEYWCYYQVGCLRLMCSSDADISLVSALLSP